MICPKCASENVDGAKFCNECGTNISVLSHEEEQGGGVSHLGGALTLIRPGYKKGQTVQEPDTPLESRYEFLGEIGRGGFAVVTKVRDKELGRIVAIKRLLAEHLGGRYGQQVVERFRREAESIAKLNHLNIVTVYNRVCDRDGDYIVMEYVDGGSLRDFLKERGGKLPVAMAIHLIRGVAQGLAYAHRMNLVHRDIKPANILLSRTTGSGDGGDESLLIPKLVDFGLARAGSESDVSLSGFGMGTPFYAAPEQRRDAKNVNHTADIYSLGKTLYEMVTGEIPDTVDPEVIPPPSELAKIIIKCIKPNPGDRYFSADEFIAALTQIEGKKSSVASVMGGKAVGAEDACPACGMVNAKDLRFCQGCGTGLIRPCPECGRELRVQAPYCGACGTDVSAFLHVQDMADRIGRYLGEKKYTRILKEFEQLSGSGFIPRGPKATALISSAQEAQTAATEAETKKKALLDAVDEAWKQKDCDQIELLFRHYKEVNGALEEEFNRLRDRLPVIRQIQTLKRHVDRLKEAVKSRDWASAQTMFNQKPPVPETVELEEEQQINDCLTQVSTLYANMSATLAAEHSQKLKRLRAEILVAKENAQWPHAWQLVNDLPDLPAMLLDENRTALSELTSEIKAQAALIAQGWLQDLSDRAVLNAQQGDWDGARNNLQTIDTLPLDPKVRTEWYQAVDAQLTELRVNQLRRIMHEALENHHWDAARDAASTLEKLAAGDEEAQQVIAAGMQGKRRDQKIVEIFSLFKKGLFQKCTVLCDGLIQEVGPAFNLTGNCFTGSLGNFRTEAAQHAMEQAAQIATLKSSLLNHDWEGAIRQASDLINDYDWMSEAKEGLGQALEGKRRARLKRGALVAVSSAIMLMSAWGTFRLFGCLRVRSDFYAAVKRDDETKARELATTFLQKYMPAQVYLKCLKLHAAADEKRRLALFEGSEMSGCASWSQAETLMQTAEKDFKNGRFDQAATGFEHAPDRYQEAVVWGRKYKTSVDQFKTAAQAYKDVLQKLDPVKLEKYGGMPWVDAQRCAAEGLAPQTDPDKLDKCSNAMRAGAKALLNAVENVKREETRIENERREIMARLQTAWQKAGEAYKTERQKQDLGRLNLFGGDSWKEAERLAKLGDLATDADAGCKAYDSALKNLLQAVDVANRRWTAVEADVLRRYNTGKSECLRRFGEAQAAKNNSRAGYTAAVECQELLKKVQNEDGFAGIRDEEKEFIRKLQLDVSVLVAERYRGPDPKESRWVIPGTELAFVWVEKLGAWVGQTEVSNREFRRFAPEHASGSLFSFSLDENDQPVVMVTFEEAKNFARYLRQREQAARQNPPGYKYRLLTSNEWMLCVQCGRNSRYPWGNEWPPTGGNYSDNEIYRRSGGYGFSWRQDPWPVSAPVGRSVTNEWGLCDMGGNVKEWTYGADRSGVVCDASWRTSGTNETECAYSIPLPDTAVKMRDVGFRLILAEDSKLPALLTGDRPKKDGGK